MIVPYLLPEEKVAATQRKTASCLILNTGRNLWKYFLPIFKYGCLSALPKRQR